MKRTYQVGEAKRVAAYFFLPFCLHGGMGPRASWSSLIAPTPYLPLCELQKWRRFKREDVTMATVMDEGVLIRNLCWQSCDPEGHTPWRLHCWPSDTAPARVSSSMKTGVSSSDRCLSGGSNMGGNYVTRGRAEGSRWTAEWWQERV